MSMTYGSRGQMVEMNVTPLIDVLLVLIIIFMVVSPNHSQGEQADIPQAAPTDSHALPPDNNIVVQLLDRGEGVRPALMINASEVSWEDLPVRMKDILLPRAQRVVFLKSDPGVEFEFVAQAVDFSRAAGAERVGLMPGGR
jgi:biopolymer transport protein TolR